MLTTRRAFMALFLLLSVLSFGVFSSSAEAQGSSSSSSACDYAVNFGHRFIGSAGDSVSVNVDLPAGEYAFTFGTSDSYDGRDQTDPAGQTSERVSLFGVVSADLEDGVEQASASTSGSVVLANAVTSITATHVPATGPDSVVIGTVCLNRIPTAPSGDINADSYCVDATPWVGYEFVTANLPANAVVKVVMSAGGNDVDVTATPEVVSPISSGNVTFSLFVDGVVLSESTVIVADCTPVLPEPPTPSISFVCVGSDSQTVTVNVPAGPSALPLVSAEAYVNGVAVAQEGGSDAKTFTFSVAPGDTVEAVGIYLNDTVARASVVTGDCVPEVEQPVIDVTFECVSPTEVSYNVTVTGGDIFWIVIDGEQVDASGVMPAGADILVETTVDGIYTEVVTNSEVLTAPDCAPEVVGGVTISTSCNADLTLRDFSVTADAGTRIVSVLVDGVAFDNTGTIEPGQTITVTSERDGIYSEVVAGSDSLVVKGCELPVTGAYTSIMIGGALLAIIVGLGALWVARERKNVA